MGKKAKTKNKHGGGEARKKDEKEVPAQKKEKEPTGESSNEYTDEQQDDASQSSHGEDEENHKFDEDSKGNENEEKVDEEAADERQEENVVADSKHSDEQKQLTESDKKKKAKGPLSDKFLKKTENFNDKLRKRGVVYVARVPPKMTPTKVKTLLSDFGEITRVYLVEEDKAVRQRRRKQGGSGAKRYTEGWVEFAKKKIAKHVAQSLNNTPITKYKRSAHYGDLWNLKYLHKFKWSHLTEKVAYERRVREQKLRVEMMQARRENANYVELVETGKKLDKIEERKRKRMEREGISPDGKESEEKSEQKEKRKKRQTKPLDDKSESATKKALLRALVQE